MKITSKIEAPDVSSFAPPFFFFSNNQLGEITFVSPSIKQVLGFTPENLIGRSIYDLFDMHHPLNRDVKRSMILRFRGDTTQHSLRAVLDRNGQCKLITVQTIGVKNVEGNVVRNQGIAQDVSDRSIFTSKLVSKLADLQVIHDELTKREIVILDLVLRGEQNKSIAKQLDVSVRTVENYRKRLYAKFGADSIVDLVAKATQFRMLTDILLSEHPAHPTSAPKFISEINRVNVDPPGERSSVNHNSNS